MAECNLSCLYLSYCRKSSLLEKLIAVQHHSQANGILSASKIPIPVPLLVRGPAYYFDAKWYYLLCQMTQVPFNYHTRSSSSVGRFGLAKRLPSATCWCSDLRLKWNLAQYLSSLTLQMLRVGANMTSCGREFPVLVALRVRKFCLTILYALCFFRLLSWPVVMLLLNLIYSASTWYINVTQIQSGVFC